MRTLTLLLLASLPALAEWTREPTLGGSWRCDAGGAADTRAIEGLGPEASVLGGWLSLSRGASNAGVTLADGRTVGIGLAEGFFVTEPAGAQYAAPAWGDPACPLDPWQAYHIELIREAGRFRAQLLASDGRTPLSQSPWLTGELPLAGASLVCRGGVARFGDWAESGLPSCELLAFPPNEARLAGKGSGWTITGGGSWRWTDASRTTVAQERVTERTFAFLSSAPTGPGLTRSHVRIEPGAGGAGIVVQSDESLSRGFFAWLGGTFGAGCLMLYDYGPGGLRERWAGAQDRWHYEEDLVVSIEVRPGEARVRLEDAAGALRDESPWIAVDPAQSAAEGLFALQTWLGKAQFAGFPGSSGEPVVATDGAPASKLGVGWVEAGAGAAELSAAGALTLSAGEARHAALPPAIEGAIGTWSGTVRLEEGASAGLAIQSDHALAQGLVVLLDAQAGRLTLREQGVEGPPIWETAVALEADVPYGLHLERLTDVITVRLTNEAGEVLAERERCYIPVRYNELRGRLALVVERGTAHFAAWSLEAGGE